MPRRNKTKQTNKPIPSSSKPTIAVKVVNNKSKRKRARIKPKPGRYLSRINTTKLIEPLGNKYRIRNNYVNNGTIVLSHSEAFHDVSYNAGFYLSTIMVNPGNQALFPWLSNVAPSWQSYKIRQISINYYPDASKNETGSIYFAFASDPNQVNPTTASQMMAYNDALKIPISEGGVFRIKPDQKYRYVITTVTPPDGRDATTYFAGKLWYATQGITDTSQTKGTLFVEYTIDLTQPVFDDSEEQLDYVVERLPNYISNFVFADYFMKSSLLAFAVVLTNRGLLDPVLGQVTVTQSPQGDKKYATINFPETGTYDIVLRCDTPQGVTVAQAARCGWFPYSSGPAVIESQNITFGPEIIMEETEVTNITVTCRVYVPIPNCVIAYGDYFDTVLLLGIVYSRIAMSITKVYNTSTGIEVSKPIKLGPGVDPDSKLMLTYTPPPKKNSKTPRDKGKDNE